MLTTAGPVRAVEEIAHELMHAAELGITWPDEHFIGRALKLEVSLRCVSAHGDRGSTITLSIQVVFYT